MDVQYACEESVFNIVRCNWADEVEDSMDLGCTSGSDISTSCDFPKQPSASLSLNLLRQKAPDKAWRGACNLDLKQPAHSGLRHQSQKKKKATKGEGKARKAELPRKSPLLDLGGLGEEAWSGLTTLGSRADTSRNWNADKAGGSEGKRSARRKGLASAKSSSGSGSSTSRSGSSTARSVASRADTEEWTRPLRVNPDAKGREASGRHARSSSDTWRSSSSSFGSKRSGS